MNDNLEILYCGERRIMNNTIMAGVRDALDLSPDGDDFNTIVKMHIWSCLTILNQNGIGQKLQTLDENTTWDEFIDPEQDNSSFPLVPMFVYTKTRILFDPPPPSNVEFYAKMIDEYLWRLRLDYDKEVSNE